MNLSSGSFFEVCKIDGINTANKMYIKNWKPINSIKIRYNDNKTYKNLFIVSFFMLSLLLFWHAITPSKKYCISEGKNLLAHGSSWENDNELFTVNSIEIDKIKKIYLEIYS